MNNGLFTYLAALLLFGSNGIIAAAIALPSSDIVLLRTFLGALSLVTILAITQHHKLQAPSRPREAGVENGGDTFDCVAPARCGRNGAIFTRHGRYNIKRAQFKHDFGPLEEDCDCYTCTHYSRAYVDHALRAREFNGFTLATIHNEHFFVKLLDDIRASIDGGYFNEFRDETLAKFYENGSKG